MENLHSRAMTNELVLAKIDLRRIPACCVIKLGLDCRYSYLRALKHIFLDRHPDQPTTDKGPSPSDHDRLVGTLETLKGSWLGISTGESMRCNLKI